MATLTKTQIHKTLYPKSKRACAYIVCAPAAQLKTRQSMCLYCLNERLDAEEQRQRCGDKEDTCVKDHHYILLDYLLRDIKHEYQKPRKAKTTKTNWKQEFQQLE